MGKKKNRHKTEVEDEIVRTDSPDGETGEGVETPTDETEEVLPSVEDYSALRADEISESIREIRRKAESNGGYVTYEELNRMLPQGVVDAIQSDRKMAQKPVSLQSRLGDDGDATVGDLIPDAGRVNPFEATEGHLLRERLQMVLGTLSGREREVVDYRFGLSDGYSRTLEEVGRFFNVTRERVRQIESKALRKLRHPSRMRALREYFVRCA